MKKDRLLEEYNKMKVSNPQEFTGGKCKLVEYTTHYTSYKSTNSGTSSTMDKLDDTDTDYYEDTVITDTTAVKGFLGM